MFPSHRLPFPSRPVSSPAPVALEAIASRALARHNARCDYSHSRGFAHAMDETSNLNSTTTNGSDTRSSDSPIVGVIAAAAVVVALLALLALLAIVPSVFSPGSLCLYTDGRSRCMRNRRRQHPGGQVDMESREDAPNGTTGLQTLNSTSPAQNYKFSQASKSQSSLPSHKSNSSEVWYVLEFFFF